MTLNRPNPRLAILRAQLAAKAEAEQLQRDTMRLMALAPIRCKAPAPDAATLPLPPSYWDDMEEMWPASAETLAPAKPAAKQPEPSSDVWHSEAPSVVGVYIASADRCTGVISYWNGSKWHIGAGNVRDARRMPPRTTFAVEWFRLIEADAPTDLAARLASTSGAADGAALIGFDRSAAPGVAKLTHSVCIKAHGGWKVGQVRVTDAAFPECFVPCDKDGWIPHTPTADSTCPVPDGMEFEVKRNDGFPVQDGTTILHWAKGSAICAWRPIADGSK